MNAHHTIGIVKSVAKMPEGAPASKLATRIAGEKEAKESLAPKTVNMSWIVAASAMTIAAAKNAEGDHGLTLRMTFLMQRPWVSPPGNKLPEYSWKRKHHRDVGSKRLEWGNR